MTDMTEKTVVITGASRGIGRAAALEFAREGAHVVLLARSGEPIAALARQIGDAATAVVCDVSCYQDMERAVGVALEKTGRIDVLINNAGLLDPIARLAESDPHIWARTIDVNLTGVYFGVRASLEALLQQARPTVLLVSSGAASNPLEGWSQYCSSKAGAAMLMRSLHLEYADQGLRVMGLSPGTVATDMQVQIKASGMNPVSALDPSVHSPPVWPAKALLWMCGEDADAYLGQEISLRDERIRTQVGIAP